MQRDALRDFTCQVFFGEKDQAGQIPCREAKPGPGCSAATSAQAGNLSSAAMNSHNAASLTTFGAAPHTPAPCTFTALAMSESPAVAVYFVASPLQYLAARRIAQQNERRIHNVLVWYQPGVKPVVNPTEWDACTYMAWPRLEPLPGMFGRHRRLRANIRLVADLVGQCEELIIHSAVFDTEAINYFLHALPAASGAHTVHARILPDGLISTRRYPLSLAKRLLQRVRTLRSLIAPELRYTCFAGDRIGSDAPFCDCIYVLAGFSHQYPSQKVRKLPPLADVKYATSDVENAQKHNPKRALVIGQPLVGAGLIAAADLPDLTLAIHDWLVGQGIKDIDYKPHPKDQSHELFHPDYRLIEPAMALEQHMASTLYDVVVGVRSSGLLFARQIYPPEVMVEAFGWKYVRFKSDAEFKDMKDTFASCGVGFNNQT